MNFFASTGLMGVSDAAKDTVGTGGSCGEHVRSLKLGKGRKAKLSKRG